MGMELDEWVSPAQHNEKLVILKAQILPIHENDNKKNSEHRIELCGPANKERCARL